MSSRRIRDYGVHIGSFPTGPRNSIGDIPGVTVGHCTIDTKTRESPPHLFSIEVGASKEV